MNYLVHGITAVQLSKISKELAVLKFLRMGMQDTDSKPFMSVAKPTQKDPHTDCKFTEATPTRDAYH